MLDNKVSSKSYLSRFTKETRIKLLLAFLFIMVALFTLVLIVAYYQAIKTGNEFTSLATDWFHDPSTYIAIIPAALFLTTMLIKVKVSIETPQGITTENAVAAIEVMGYSAINNNGTHITFKPTPGKYEAGNRRKFRLERQDNKLILTGPVLSTVRLSRLIETQLYGL